MDHEISVKTQAAEKYLLGELRPAEREAFEQHFFECSECAEDVRIGFEFTENAKAVFRQEPAPIYQSTRSPARRDWFAWMRPALLAPAAASLAIVAFSGYQNVIEIPALRAHVEELQRPQIVASTVLAPSSRSSVPSIAISPAVQFVQLSLAIGALAPAERYQCDLRSDSGKSIATVPISKLDPDANLTLLIPTASLSIGYYEAVLAGVTGGAATELDHYRFSVRRE
jgi:putative zinc finger protein